MLKDELSARLLVWLSSYAVNLSGFPRRQWVGRVFTLVGGGGMANFGGGGEEQKAALWTLWSRAIVWGRIKSVSLTLSR